MLRVKKNRMDPDNYNSTFKNWPPLVRFGRWVYGIWIIGNNYKSKKKYYGEYPPTYLKRIKALFPNARNVLHLFSGVVEKGLWSNEVTLDIREELNPDICCDAEELSKHVRGSYDLILADPPYSGEDAAHYGRPLINRFKVITECVKILTSGGYLVWLDQVFPMFRKSELKLIGTIGIIRSTNHRVRTVFVFKRFKR